MSKIKKLATSAAGIFTFDGDGFLENAQEVQNWIFDQVCSEYADRLPPGKLLGKSNEDFNECDIGEWGIRRLNRAARTMQTIYDMAIDIAQTDK